MLMTKRSSFHMLKSGNSTKTHMGHQSLLTKKSRSLSQTMLEFGLISTRILQVWYLLSFTKQCVHTSTFTSSWNTLLLLQKFKLDLHIGLYQLQSRAKLVATLKNLNALWDQQSNNLSKIGDNLCLTETLRRDSTCHWFILHGVSSLKHATTKRSKGKSISMQFGRSYRKVNKRKSRKKEMMSQKIKIKMKTKRLYQ